MSISLVWLDDSSRDENPVAPVRSLRGHDLMTIKFQIF